MGENLRFTLFDDKKLIENKESTSIYSMHKYWGKKPSSELKMVIERYTKENDLILDPFAGYGGIGVEALILNRNVIVNDLNPIANFIAECLLEKNVDMRKVNTLFKKIKNEYKCFNEEWYSILNKENEFGEVIITLRDKKDIPKKVKYKLNGSNIFKEKDLSSSEIRNLMEKENNFKCDYWFPIDDLIENSRISAKKDMKVYDLFTKRALICHSYLYHLLSKIPNSNEKKMLLLAFTSNLANCSKLVPPIKSRGELSQGSWMTGFHIGEQYLENNVFHYFENRVKKIIKGKEIYLNKINSSKKTASYSVTNYDAKKINMPSESIDFVFTDFPYGDTVPYFEQSQIWNVWLNFDVDYENEIVVSNSKQRNKSIELFSDDIDSAVSEIARVLKINSHFVFTFHSLNGKEWLAISNALVKHGFMFVECDLMLQKTLTPRQLNRKISIKGDLLVVYKKVEKIISQKAEDLEQRIISSIKTEFEGKKYIETNDLIMICVYVLLNSNIVIRDINFLEIINSVCEIDELNSKWRLK